MPAIQCPIETCTYVTPDVDPVIVAALLTTHSTSHTTSGGSSAAARMDKVKRLTISLAGTSEDWKYFICRWEDYATATRITERDKVVQLLECCDEQLKKDLARSAGTALTQKHEDDVLAAIKSLAVREENTMVARVTLNDMKQERDESIRSFGARIRWQAIVCKYVIDCHQCSEEVNYTKAILCDVLCRSIDDTEIQLDLLGDLN